MKIDSYFPHDTHMRHNPEIISLIESENASGYGVYWAILEYLRTQEDYKGDTRAIRGIARQIRSRLDKVIRVLNNYGLFVVEGSSFYSPALNEMMQPLEQKRARKKMRQKSDGMQQKNDRVFQVSCKPLEISPYSDKVKESKEKKKETSNKEKGDVAVPLAWERYVDELAKEQQWKEIMAMRSTLGRVFVDRFAEVLQHFKRHVLAVGSEDRIRSLSDAKHYFNNFNTPGSPTFVRLSAELMKPVDRGKFRYEDNDPATGQRSYCGVPIPPDAPPRPNEQAVWCEGEWVY